MMRSVNKVAVVLVAIASTVTVVQKATWAMAVYYSFVMEPDHPVLEWALRLTSMAASVGIIVVLVRNGPVIDAGRKFRTVLRVLIIAASAAYLVIETAWAISGVEVGELWQDHGGSLPWWYTVPNVLIGGAGMDHGGSFPWWVTVPAFLIGGVGLVAPAVLGITMLAQGDRSPAAWLLSAAVAVYAVTYLGLAALGSQWADITYAVMVMNFGLALLGADQPREAPHHEPSAVTK